MRSRLLHPAGTQAFPGSCSISHFSCQQLSVLNTAHEEGEIWHHGDIA